MKEDTVLQQMQKDGKLSVSTKADLENLVSTYLKELGAPPTLRGYDTAMSAIWLILTEDRPDIMTIYNRAAVQQKTTGSRVERNMRTLVTRVFNNAPAYLIDLIFRNAYSINRGSPTNKEFLYTLARYIEMNYKVNLQP